MRPNLEAARITKSMLLHGNRFGVSFQTLTGTTTIPPDSPHILAWDPGGAGRTVKLPASPTPGDWFLIMNMADAAEVITVQDSAAAALTPACTPTQSESAFVVYVNATLGWRNFVAIGA